MCNCYQSMQRISLLLRALQPALKCTAGQLVCHQCSTVFCLAGLSRECSHTRHQACICGLQVSHCPVHSFRWQPILQHQQRAMHPDCHSCSNLGPHLPQHQADRPGCAGAHTGDILLSLSHSTAHRCHLRQVQVARHRDQISPSL